MRLRAVVEYALPHLVVQVSAVVIRLDEALGLVGVRVKGVEVGADILDGCKVLAFELVEASMREKKR